MPPKIRLFFQGWRPMMTNSTKHTFGNHRIDICCCQNRDTRRLVKDFLDSFTSVMSYLNIAAALNAEKALYYFQL
jgi:hypothetical protein